MDDKITYRNLHVVCSHTSGTLLSPYMYISVTMIFFPMHSPCASWHEHSHSLPSRYPTSCGHAKTPHHSPHPNQQPAAQHKSKHNHSTYTLYIVHEIVIPLLQRTSFLVVHCFHAHDELVYLLNNNIIITYMYTYIYRIAGNIGGN